MTGIPNLPLRWRSVYTASPALLGLLALCYILTRRAQPIAQTRRILPQHQSDRRLGNRRTETFFGSHGKFVRPSCVRTFSCFRVRGHSILQEPFFGSTRREVRFDVADISKAINVSEVEEFIP